MKHYFLLLVGVLTLVLSAPSARAEDFDDAHRFIFYAVLEGGYEDGVSTEDVSQILLKGEKDKYHYSHFVYACPVCTPTIHALEAYRSRPDQFYSLKKRGSTFGSGLTADLKKQLYSEKPEDRLGAINLLMQAWVSKRIAQLRLSEQERTQLQTKLEEMRKKGMAYLKNWEADNLTPYPMDAFKNVHQCAVCNGACGMKLKPEAGK